VSSTEDPQDHRARRRSIVRDSLGVGIATGVYGVSFGAISVASGLSIAQTCVLSLLMFTGASQFALVGVIASGGSPLSSALTALLLGTRNTLYGLKLAGMLGLGGPRRVLGSHLVIDESTAMSVLRETREDARLGFWVTGIAVFLGWNSFTLIGAVAGAQLGDPRTYGLDAAVGAAFLALLWPRLTDRHNQYVAAAAVVVALGLVPIATAGVPVLAAGGVALLAGVLTRRSTDRTELPGARS
jgi:4-azaleucine resistance transporter AzlC